MQSYTYMFRKPYTLICWHDLENWYNWALKKYGCCIHSILYLAAFQNTRNVNVWKYIEKIYIKINKLKNQQFWCHQHVVNMLQHKQDGSEIWNRILGACRKFSEQESHILLDMMVFVVHQVRYNHIKSSLSKGWAKVGISLIISHQWLGYYTTAFRLDFSLEKSITLLHNTVCFFFTCCPGLSGN